jgi:hypothetical protein
LCFTVATAITPSSFDIRLPYVRNAIGIALGSDIVDWIAVGALTLFITNVTACAAAVVVRFRRARGDERQQLKWVVYAAALAIVLFNLMFLLTIVFELEAIPSAVYYVGLASMPIGVGIAILRHRLYDIDVLINRTLVYDTLTISLALVYVGSVVPLRAVLARLTGSSEPAIVASTLAIAALFNPLRKRIQNTIDKRFYRRKYNAVEVLAAFGATVRDQTDLHALTSEMLRVMDETMQPEQVSLWMRTSTNEVER